MQFLTSPMNVGSLTPGDQIINARGIREEVTFLWRRETPGFRPYVFLVLTEVGTGKHRKTLREINLPVRRVVGARSGGTI